MRGAADQHAVCEYGESSARTLKSVVDDTKVLIVPSEYIFSTKTQFHCKTIEQKRYNVFFWSYRNILNSFENQI